MSVSGSQECRRQSSTDVPDAGWYRRLPEVKQSGCHELVADGRNRRFGRNPAGRHCSKRGGAGQPNRLSARLLSLVYVDHEDFGQSFLEIRPNFFRSAASSFPISGARQRRIREVERWSPLGDASSPSVLGTTWRSRLAGVARETPLSECAKLLNGGHAGGPGFGCWVGW